MRWHEPVLIFIVVIHLLTGKYWQCIVCSIHSLITMDFKGFLFHFSFLVCFSSFVVSTLVYPEVRRDETVVDDYHGTKISDPYRWLEDTESEETQNFVEVENNLTFSYLRGSPSRNIIQEKLTKSWNYPKQGLPKKRGNRYYIYKNSGVQNQWVLYYAPTLEQVLSSPEVFFDPNTLSTDGTVSLNKVAISEDGELFAYALAKSGSDWTDIYVKNVTSKEDFPEVLKFARAPSIDWTHDNLGFFYSRHPDNGKEKFAKAHDHERIYYHKVGTNQSEDVLVVEFTDHPDWSIACQLSDDGEYFYVSGYNVINELHIFYARITQQLKEGFQEKLKLISLTDIPAYYNLVATQESIFYFITNVDAPRYRLIGMDVNNPSKQFWTTIIPEHQENVLNWASAIANDKLVVSYTQDVTSTAELRNLYNGTLIQSFPLEPAAIVSTEGRRQDMEFYFKVSTYSNPGTTYFLNLSSPGPYKAEVFAQDKVPGINHTQFVTNQVFYSSKDGTRIPMFLLHRKNFTRTGNSPTFMYGYGGFGSTADPYFSIAYIFFAKYFDGVIAIPGIRGGGEYGTEWWDNGRLLKKQNVFDDFAAAAEYLIKMNYTSPSKLVIQGASNGGLLVAACLNQRPELYGAGIVEVGVTEMLRFQKFTVGPFWCGEYGCSENKTHFENLIKYSPLHNIRVPPNDTQYPAILVETSDHDDRVVPLHSYKYIAELQHTIGRVEKQTNPLLIRVEENAGHGRGRPTSKNIAQIVDMYAFLELSLQYTFHDD